MERYQISGWTCGRWAMLAWALAFTALLLTGCGPGREEKERRREIQAQGEANAIRYVEEKYGFTPEVEEVQICTERGDGDLVPWANGYVLALMRRGEDTFKVHISGEKETLEGQDDLQYKIILEDVKGYMGELLGYEIYDLYLCYREEQESQGMRTGQEDREEQESREEQAGQEDQKEQVGQEDREEQAGQEDREERVAQEDREERVGQEERQDREGGGGPPECHKEDLIGELYSPGDLGGFLKRHPATIRIDDCLGQDLTDMGLGAVSPAAVAPPAAAFFAEYAKAYGMKAVLISYRDETAYQKGLDHTYGRGGVLTFGIWEDGLWIHSYAAFDQEGTETGRFEQQAYEELLFSCVDQVEGEDLQIGASREGWMDLGETNGEPLSKIYSVGTDQTGPVTVYLPVERYGKRPSVYIQHYDDGKWWQYEASVGQTKDGQYNILTYMGIPDGNFQFAVFP